MASRLDRPRGRRAKGEGGIGEDRAGSRRRATSYDVARLARVSQSAVSRAFSAGASVSPTMRARVLAAAKQLGFTPNLLARSLIKQRSNIVALVVTELTTRVTPYILYRFGVELQRAGLHLLLFTVDGESPDDAVMAQLLDYPLDGVVSCTTLGAEHLRRLRARGVPLVLFNRVSPSRAVASVRCDHVGMAAELAGKLFAAGHRRFAFVTGPEDAPVSQEREHGFVGALQRLGVERVERFRGDYSYQSGREAGLVLAARRRRPQAVFCANDTMALGVLDALRIDAGLRVPQDVSVVGFDDVADAGQGAYNLTTVRPPLDAMVARAIELLRAGGGARRSIARRVLLPGQIIVRGSARL
jgi:DNA-binding LacI/PurR family transcriptional regulator